MLIIAIALWGILFASAANGHTQEEVNNLQKETTQSFDKLIKNITNTFLTHIERIKDFTGEGKKQIIDDAYVKYFDGTMMDEPVKALAQLPQDYCKLCERQLFVKLEYMRPDVTEELIRCFDVQFPSEVLNTERLRKDMDYIIGNLKSYQSEMKQCPIAHKTMPDEAYRCINDIASLAMIWYGLNFGPERTSWGRMHTPLPADSEFDPCYDTLDKQYPRVVHEHVETLRKCTKNWEPRRAAWSWSWLCGLM